MTEVKILNLLPFFILLLQGCNPSAPPAEIKSNVGTQDNIVNLNSAPADFPTLYSAILEPKCLSCHDQLSSEAGLGDWVVPHSPEESSLYLSVVDGYMPKGAAALTSEELEFVARYIDGFSGSSSSGGTSSGEDSSGGVSGGDSGSDSGGGSTTSGGSSGGTSSYISYNQLKTNILTPKKCLNCHSLEADSEAALVANWVTLSVPEESRLYKRVVDNTMPRSSAALTAEEKAYVLQYIYDYKARQ